MFLLKHFLMKNAYYTDFKVEFMEYPADQS